MIHFTNIMSIFKIYVIFYYEMIMSLFNYFNMAIKTMNITLIL